MSEDAENAFCSSRCAAKDSVDELLMLGEQQCES